MSVPVGDDQAVVIYCQSAGADLNMLRQLIDNRDELGLYHYSLRIGGLYKSIRQCHYPIVCVPCDYVIGGAFGIMLACDLVLSMPNTRFRLPEIRHGIIPSQIFSCLEQRLGYEKALAVACHCDLFNAKSAYHRGLIDRVLPSRSDITFELLNWTQSSPAAIRVLKQNKPDAAVLDNQIEKSAVVFASHCLQFADI